MYTLGGEPSPLEGKKKKLKRKEEKEEEENTHNNNNSMFITFKGVLHPRPVFGLFLHFSQKLQHIGNK